MKVFEVTTTYDGDKEVITTKKYVTSENDSLLNVTKYFTIYCYQYDGELIGVREVLPIMQHIKMDKETEEFYNTMVNSCD